MFLLLLSCFFVGKEKDLDFDSKCNCSEPETKFCVLRILSFFLNRKLKSMFFKF